MKSPAAGMPIRHRAEALSGRLPPLLIAAERVASSVSQGVHGRRRVGVGETFWQFRHYVPGDETTHIDWRQTAKGDSVFVRETEWEAAQSVWLWRDRSDSMDFASDGVRDTKRNRAELLLLALAFLISRSGERAALLNGGDPPTGGRNMPTRLAALLDRQSGSSVSLPPPARLPRYGRVVLFGDFLVPVDQAADTFGRLAGQGVRGHAVRIVDPAEAHFPFEGRIRFQEREEAGDILIGRAETVREEYLARAEAHDRALAEAARTWGWTYLVHHTNRPPETALLAVHRMLAEQR